MHPYFFALFFEDFLLAFLAFLAFLAAFFLTLPLLVGRRD